MRKISIRNLIIALLCFTVIILAIGFCIISVKLENYKNKVEKFEVIFTKVKEDSSVKGGLEDPKCVTSINDDGYSVNMNFTLNNPLDEISYLVTVKNTGTIKAKIIDIISSPDYINDKFSADLIKPISITKTDISGKVLDPDEETTFKILAVYNNANVKEIKKIPYKLSLITASVE